MRVMRAGVGEKLCDPLCFLFQIMVWCGVMDVEARGSAFSEEPRVASNNLHHAETLRSASTAMVVRVEPGR